jgi:putative FmdB family regulatory protein
MPLYEYECEACGKRFEVIQKFSDPHTDTCRVCGKGPIRRLVSSPAIQFKGTGWYITDYSQKGKSNEASSPTGSSSAAGSGESSSNKDTDKSAAKSGDSGGSASESKPAAAPAGKSDAS